jgi:hypothetical protein
MDGSKVADAFRQGEMARIARYCESDVATVLNLQRVLVDDVDPVPSLNLYSVDSDGEYLQLAGARPDGSCPSAWYGDNCLYLPPFSRDAAAILAGRVVELGRKGTSTPEQLQALTSPRIPREPSGCIPSRSCSTT